MKDPLVISNFCENLIEEFGAFAKQDRYELRRDKVITERGSGDLSCIFAPHDQPCTKYDLYQLIWNALQIALEDSEKEFKKQVTDFIKQQQQSITTTKGVTRSKTIEEICQQLINVLFKVVTNFYGLGMKTILLPCVRKNMDNFTRLFIGQFNSDHESLSTTATSKNGNGRVIITFLSNLET